MVALPDEPFSPARRGILRKRFSRFLETWLPERLYARTLIIVIAPMVLLQSIITFLFMEKHWDKVTKYLSRAVSRDIAMIIDVYENYPQDKKLEKLTQMVRDRLDMSITFLPDTELPPPQPKPFFSLLDRRLSREIRRNISLPYWIDTVGRSNYVDIRIKLKDGSVLRVITKRRRAYARNSHIFILWMVGASLLLLTVAIIFLRNQIRPILRLADAAESFGKGREPPPDFHPQGALEVQRAAAAFLQMRERIERQIEQRTAMLAGVSHDLRTILTRFNLELALLEDSPETEDMRSDIKEMQRMLEGYMSFARGDSGEDAELSDIGLVLTEIQQEMKKAHTCDIALRFKVPLEAIVKRDAIKRCLANLVQNACQSALRIRISAVKNRSYLEVVIEDDGPGIAPDQRENVFRPFYRLDEARNQDAGGTGLGLAIARDIARNHGGDITLSDSELGGLKATVHIPL